MSDIFNLFLKYNPDFIGKLDLFPVELRKKILNKLKKTSTETFFLSLVSEMDIPVILTPRSGHIDPP